MIVSAHDVLMGKVGERLALITESNGYNNTVKTLVRASNTVFKGYDLPGINYWSTGMLNERSAYKSDLRTLPLLVEYYTKTWEPDTPFDSVCASLAADVVTALNRDPSAPAVSDPYSPKLGGIVSDFVFNRYDNQLGEGQKPWCGILASFSIVYRTVINDMSTYKG